MSITGMYLGVVSPGISLSVRAEVAVERDLGKSARRWRWRRVADLEGLVCPSYCASTRATRITTHHHLRGLFGSKADIEKQPPVF